ncbi:hypothetical protein [Phyllobacterium sp. K27]
MGLLGNRKTGRRGTAPLLISVFWLISTLSATLAAGYLVDRDANIASTGVGSPLKNETRFAREADSSSVPTQRPLRVVALETLHLKIKSGLRADAGPQDGFLPGEPRLVMGQKFAAAPEQCGSGRVADCNSFFSARAPPFTA